jgi:hypothetical protein
MAWEPFLPAPGCGISALDVGVACAVEMLGGVVGVTPDGVVVCAQDPVATKDMPIAAMIKRLSNCFMALSPVFGTRDHHLAKAISNTLRGMWQLFHCVSRPCLRQVNKGFFKLFSGKLLSA